MQLEMVEIPKARLKELYKAERELAKAHGVAPRLFSAVQTPDGVGTLIGVTTQANGLYFDRVGSIAHVWYGMDNVQNGKVQWTYPLSEVTPA